MERCKIDSSYLLTKGILDPMISPEYTHWIFMMFVTDKMAHSRHEVSNVPACQISRDITTLEYERISSQRRCL